MADGGESGKLSGSDDDDAQISTPTDDAQVRKATRAPRKRFVVINLSKCRYDIVRQAALELEWCIENEDRADVAECYEKTERQEAQLNRLFPNFRYRPEEHPQVHWVDTSVLLPRVAALRCYHRLNHFPNMHLICRKMVFFSRCMKLQLLFPEYYNFFPKSWSLRTDYKALDDYCRSLRGKTKTFVLKPNTGCEGKGIVLTRRPLQEAKSLRDQDYIVQLYVHRPLLIDKKKFDMRVYVLMTLSEGAENRMWANAYGHQPTEQADVPWWQDGNAGAGGLQVFVHSEGLVRICSEPYAKPTADNLSDVYKHLTNYALNKTNDSYVYAGGETDEGAKNEDAQDLEDEGDGTEGFTGNKRDFRFLREYVNRTIPVHVFQTPDGGGCDDGNEDSCTDAHATSCASGSSSRPPRRRSRPSALPMPTDDAPRVPAERSEGTAWDLLLRRIDRAVVLSILSGVADVRQAYHASGALSGPRIDGRNCFELMGFDIMVNASGRVFVLEVNHSPSLFCDTPLDVRIKKRVVKDTLRIVTRNLPDLRKCSDSGYKKHLEKQRAKGLLLSSDVHKGTEFRKAFPLAPDTCFVCHRGDGAGEKCANDNDAAEYCDGEMDVFREVVEGIRSAAASAGSSQITSSSSFTVDCSNTRPSVPPSATTPPTAKLARLRKSSSDGSSAGAGLLPAISA